MKLISLAFLEMDPIPSKYTCDGENVIPPLEIHEVDPNAKSLALIVEDPDAPGGDFVHWIVYNIDPNLRRIKEGETPEGAEEGINDFGQKNWGGPCPPSGTHRYVFKLYGLKEPLKFDKTPNKDDFRQAVLEYKIEETKLTGLYQKQ